jgi:uncharacterized protein YyaL (SSP411 family)
MLRLFRDAEDGGLFFTATDAEDLVIRTKEAFDGATPSGNSVAALVLLKLGSLTADPELSGEGRRVIDTFAGVLEVGPLALPQMLIALDFAIGPNAEVVLAGDPESPELVAMRRELSRRFLPNVVVALRPEGEAGRRLAEIVPFLGTLGPKDGRPTAYVCQNHACSLPTHETEAMMEQLAKVGGLAGLAAETT